MTRKTESNCSVTNLTKGKLPRLPFALIKEAVLGKRYDLSLVFCSRQKIRVLNRKYRRKDKVTDILSFPLSNVAGEIHLNLDEAKKEAKKFGRNFENFVGFLFIHGLVHLEGFEHGSKMEIRERKFRNKFGI